MARVPPATWLFPLAAAWGAVAVPLWAGGLCPRLSLWHAHGLLYGYALACVGGFLATRARRAETALAAAAWLGARLGGCLPGPPAWALLLDGAFALWVATRGAWPLVEGAKRLRNRLLGLGALAVCLSALPVTAVLVRLDAGAGEAALRAALAGFAFLLAGMGGRALAPALAGAHDDPRRWLANAVQPRLEGGVLAACAAAAALLPAAATRPAGGAALVLAGLFTAVRLWRWRPWTVRRADVALLAVAYAWLALALPAWGLAELAGARPWAAAHLLTVGALGSLTAVMMARTAALRLGRGAAAAGDAALAVVLAAVAAAALLRVGGLAMAAAAAWSGALVLLATRLWRALRGAALR